MDELTVLRDRIAQLEGIQRNQEAALAHWRSEADRDAGKIARLERGERVGRDLAEEMAAEHKELQRLHAQALKQVASDKKKRGKAWRIVAAMKEACGWAYQFASTAGASVVALDNLSALSGGKEAPHEWPWPAMPYEKRKWVYVQRPQEYEVAGCDCGNEDPDWSEFAGMLWCPLCKKDFKPAHNGIFDGPIPANCAAMLGISFDRLNLETQRVERFEIDGTLAELLTAQREWSLATFGPDLRTEQILRHVAKECAEIAADPSDLVEWIDVILLAMDGYHRNGGKPEHLMRDLQAKQAINFGRRWVVKDGVCEHVREGE